MFEISNTSSINNFMSGSLSHLLDKKDLKTRPFELRRICEKIFYKGKGLRSRLVSCVAEFVGLSKKEQLFLSRIVEYIHNSSLLHDDFIDHSKIRRHNKAAWWEFSPSQAVLAGDYLLAKVNVYLAEKGNLDLLKKTALTIGELAEGEFAQRKLMLFQDKNLKKRDKVSELKTGTLFKWCLQAPFIYKKRQTVWLQKILDGIGFSMGLLFQRSDDLMDFSIRNQDQKPYLSDIKQGYFNSFACFLLRGSSLKKQRQLQKARSVSSVYKLFPRMEDKIQAFDRINSRLIQKTKKDIQKVEVFLKPKEQKLIDFLCEWVDFLYWRKK